MPRCLAIDPGGKRTGLALGDTESGLVSPLLCPPLAPNGVLHHGSDAERLAGLVKILSREQPDRVIVGLPLNMDGTAGPAAAGSQRLAEQLAARLESELPRCRVHLQDERLTSQDADARMARTGLTHKQKKARRDALAAVALLHRHLTEPTDNLV